MKIAVKVHANSSQEKIEKIREDEFEIWLKEKPVNNKANLRLIKLLRDYLSRKIRICSGFNSKNKIIEID